MTEAKLQEASFKLLFDHNPVPMWVFDCETMQFLKVNDAAIHHYGYTRDWFLEHTVFDIRPPEYHRMLRDWLRKPDRSRRGEKEWYHLTADGRRITVEIYASLVELDGRMCELVAAIDVTERRQQEARITELAYQDPLTGLPNRRLLKANLSSLTEDLSCPSVAVMLLDLDHFKNINDTFGHQVGDELIVAVAARLRSCLRQEDILARLGGDEFAVILSDLRDEDEADATARRLIACVREPFQCSGHTLLIGASIGITFPLKDGTDADTLLRNADLAMYQAKTEGRNKCRAFSPSLHLRMIARHELERDLRKAVEHGELELYYQPVVCLAGRKLQGYEALLRWNHARRGLISPAEFLPIAEETGLILGISDWVFQTACRQAMTWSEDMTIAVNSSAAHFNAGTVVGSITDALRDSGLSPARLELEITETLMIESTTRNLEQLNSIKELGVSLALDDFGTGYSSLSYLQMLPVSKLKIDRTFVANHRNTQKSTEILKASVALGRALDIVTLAEGIESEEQARYLEMIGCIQGQGYYFGRPQPAECHSSVRRIGKLA